MTVRPHPRRLLALAVATALASAFLGAVPAGGGLLGAAERVSIGAGGQANGPSRLPSISTRGEHVAFQSTADNLVAGDANGSSDVFVRDGVARTTSCVSVKPDGSPAGGSAAVASIDSGGERVAFESESSQIVAGDANGEMDVFVRSLGSNRTVCVSVNAAGSPGNGKSHTPAISADGRWVAFVSDCLDLGGTNPWNDREAVYLRDLVDGVTRQVSVTISGSALNGSCSGPAVSSDGRYVAFTSEASNLVNGDVNGLQDVFVRDMTTGTTTLVSISTGGQIGNLSSRGAAISADGRYVAFESQSSNLVPGDGNGVSDVFVRDRIAQKTVRVSVSSAGFEGEGASTKPSISADGRYVAFSSGAGNLSAGDTNGADDIFVRDTVTSTTARISLNEAGGQAGGASGGVALSPDGMYAAFFSEASDLVAGDTNGMADVFLCQAVPFRVERLAGPDRFGTAAAASARAFPTADAVVIATGRNFPDALGGSALAGVEGAPVLLVEPDSVPATTAAALARLAPKAVYVLGSERAVSAKVADAVKAQIGSATLTRIGGSDRYATADLVADRVVAAPGFDGVVYIATGGTYPDALAVSPIACLHQRPVVLVRPSAIGAPRLPSGTRQAVVLGSAAAVPEAVYSDLESRLGKANVSRIGGSDRYATAALIAAEGAKDGLSFDGVALATGLNFPDALSGGPVCARLGSVMLLTRDTSLPPVSENALAANAAWISTLRVFGSPFAVSDAVVTRARAAVGK